MNSGIKTLIKRVFPAWYSLVSTRRANARSLKAFEAMGLNRIAGKIAALSGWKVMGGPFAGMAYLHESRGSALAPKLIGSYELEIHPWIKQVLQTPYPLIANVGCAEGYYAVGLALRATASPEIHAFDVDRQSRLQCNRLARLNNVAEKIHIHSACTPRNLCGIIRPHSLIVCDCEGYEKTLLDPDLVPELRTCDMIVEAHGDAEGILSRRFSVSHTPAVVCAQPRLPSMFPTLDFLPAAERELALGEFRDGQQTWLFLRTRNGL